MTGATPVELLASFATLTFLEVVLSVDNIVFVALAAERLAPEQRSRGRAMGMALALVLRLMLLGAVLTAANLDTPLFRIAGHVVGLKAVVLTGGGLFLLAKGTIEIHDILDPGEGKAQARPSARLWPVVAQIGVINLVFSLDSVITAVGMSNVVPVMVAAVVVSTAMMAFAAGPVGRFISRRPATQMLALAFVLLVGVVLVAEGVGFHVPRGYLYFAIAFSLFVESLGAAYRRSRAKQAPPPA